MDNLPQGWVECEFEFCIEKINTQKKVKQKEYLEEGLFPIIDQGQKLIGGYSNKSDFVINIETPVIVFGDHTRCFKYIDFDFVSGADGTKIIKPLGFFDEKLFYYFCKTLNFPNKGYSRHFQYLLKSVIYIPPINEQKRIVEKIEEEFEKIDEGIEKLKLVQEQINQYKQSVLKSAFEGKLYKTTEWEETTLGESIETRNERITPNKENSEMPFIGMDCIKPNCLNIHEKYKLKDTKSVSALFKKNDVLYGRMRSYLNKVWKAEFDGSASAEFIVFKENKNIIADFLKYLLHQQDFVKYATRNASGDRPRVKFESDLAGYKFLLPPREEQIQLILQIEKRFKVADNVAKIVEENLEKVEQLKQSILKKAFEGRLVPQDLTDEPASVLLERIKKEREK